MSGELSSLFGARIKHLFIDSGFVFVRFAFTQGQKPYFSDRDQSYTSCSSSVGEPRPEVK